MGFALKSKMEFCIRSLLCSAVAVAACLVTATGSLQAQDGSEELPTLEEKKAQLPSFDDLIMSSDTGPYDWLVLNNNTVIEVSPVYPRPDTLTKMAEERSELEKQKGGTRTERDARRNRLEQLRMVQVVLPDNQAEDLELPVTQVSQIISFEKIMLWRVDELLRQGEIAKAYQMLLVVDRRVPGWKESTPRFDGLLLREANLKLEAEEPYAALALMDELAERNLANEQLPVIMGRTIDELIEDATGQNNFKKAQYLISRLSKYFANHGVVQKWTQQFKKLSADKLAVARQLSEAGQFDEASRTALEARRIWSSMSTNQVAEVSRHLSRFQTLRVPVRRFAKDAAVSPVPLEAEARHQELTTVSLFEPSAADELTYYQSSFFDVWDPNDLGREVVFSMKQTKPYFRTQPVLTSNDVAGTLANLLNPDLPTFNPRLGSFVKSFSVRSPDELRVSFNRVPLNLEALFRFPIDSEVTALSPDAKRLSTRFQLTEESSNERVYRRIVPEPDGLIPSQYHVAEIREIKFSDRHAEIQAFRRKEVDIIPHLRPWEIEVFKASGIAFVQQYAIPSTHVIVFNPKSENVRSPQLRRGLSFGVDRESMLKKIILRDDRMKYGRVASAPWHSQSYANSPLVEPPVYDHYLSFLLRLAALEQLRIPLKQEFVAEQKAKTLEAKQEWDEEQFRFDNSEQIKAVAAHIKLPKLRLVCDPDEVAFMAAEKMVDRWKLLGYEIELIPGDQDGQPLSDNQWDMMYRRVQMQEPLLDLWELLLTDTNFDVAKLAGFPDWMRQELINLDYATSFNDAQQRLFKIHRHMAAQAFLIPLWEIDDYVALQRNVAGFMGRPVSVYHDIERWLVKP